jgi:dTDP-4-dehydrorhamnose 3,5-epimerase
MDAIAGPDILLTSLARIPASGGDVLHALKQQDPGFVKFGEAYFSCVEQGAVKAWKRHLRMTMNLVVPAGQVRFVFRENDADVFRVEDIGVDRYARITVPPGVWFGFQGLSAPQSLVLNIASLPHDPDEVQRVAVSEFKYAWS